MEIQNRIVDSPLCTVCLCTGRTLHEIGDHKMLLYYVNTLREIPLCSTDIPSPALCFECMAILKRVTTFRDQAKVSYCILRTHANQNRRECLIRDVARPPRLKLHKNDPITITPMDDLSDYIQDVHKDDNTDVGVQRVFVKEEIKKEWQNSGWPHRPRLRNDPITITDKDGCDITPEGQKSVDDVQRLEVKQEIKIEWDDNEDDDNDLPQSDCSQDLLIETDKQEISNKREKKHRKKSLKGKDRKLKKSKRSKTEKEPKESAKPEQNEHKILTIELTYDEMLAEREKESKRESYVNSEYKCESCLIGFSYSKSHAAHLAAKHSADIGNYSCPICKTVMASVESFTSHYKRHMRRYECNICSKRTIDLKAMQQHYYSAHSITLKEYNCTCNICGEVSESIDKHRYHRDSHKARVQCPECEKTFSHRTGLMNHRLSVHEYRNDFPCSVCSKVFRWKTSLKRHFDKHHSKDDHAEPAAHCALCKVSFTSQSSLQRHLRNSLRHVTPNQLKFICDECNRRFADKTKLRDHIEEKHLHKTYQCHLCLKPSKNRVGLDQHIRNVHKGRPNNKICHHCGKGFPTRVQLESHIRSHTGERPFICEFCPTTFSQQSNLYKHNRQRQHCIKISRVKCNAELLADVQVIILYFETSIYSSIDSDPRHGHERIAVIELKIELSKFTCHVIVTVVSCFTVAVTFTESRLIRSEARSRNKKSKKLSTNDKDVKDDKVLDINLETTFLFDPKDTNKDMNILTKLRTFIDKMETLLKENGKKVQKGKTYGKKVGGTGRGVKKLKNYHKRRTTKKTSFTKRKKILKSSRSRPHFRHGSSEDDTNEVLTQFLTKLGSILQTYGDKELKKVTEILEKEVAELLDAINSNTSRLGADTVYQKLFFDPKMKAYIMDVVHSWTLAEPSSLRETVKQLRSGNGLNGTTTRFVKSLNAVYGARDAIIFNKINENLARFPETKIDLTPIIKEGLKRAILDKFNQTITDAGEDISERISELNEYIDVTNKNSTPVKSKPDRRGRRLIDEIFPFLISEEDDDSGENNANRRALRTFLNGSVERITQDSEKEDDLQNEIVTNKGVEINVLPSEWKGNGTILFGPITEDKKDDEKRESIKKDEDSSKIKGETKILDLEDEKRNPVKRDEKSSKIKDDTNIFEREDKKRNPVKRDEESSKVETNIIDHEDGERKPVKIDEESSKDETKIIDDEAVKQTLDDHTEASNTDQVTGSNNLETAVFDLADLFVFTEKTSND